MIYILKTKLYCFMYQENYNKQQNGKWFFLALSRFSMCDYLKRCRKRFIY